MDSNSKRPRNRSCDQNNEEVEDQEELVENDIYLIELHKRLTLMKKDRKKAEQDASLLDNRLKLLKGEEEKTWKKIEVTKKKTQEKIENIQNYEETMRMKQDLKLQKEKDTELQREKNKQMKEYLKMSLEQRRQYKLNEIMQEANMLKEQKRKNDEFREFLKREEQMQNKNRCEFIRTQQLLQEEKKRALELERMNKMKSELEKKILEEQSMKEKAEDKLVNLEQEEIEIMKRIRTTTQVHKAMVDDYEKINVKNLSGSKEAGFIGSPSKKNY